MNDVLLMLFFFGVMAVGSLCGERLRLAKSVATLLTALLIGSLAIWLFDFGTVLKAEQAQISFFRNVLFLLFICATGYQIGPDFAKMKPAIAWRGVLTALAMALFSFGIAAFIWRMKWLDISELIGVTAGGVTQTAILEIAHNSLSKVPADYNGKVSLAFAITYLVSTAVTILMCRWLPSLFFRHDLAKDAETAANTGETPHPSSKVLLFPERQCRVFRFVGNQMSVTEAAAALAPVTLQGVIPESQDAEGTVKNGDQLILLADRCQLKKLPKWIGNEVMDIPLETASRYRYVSQSIRLREKDAGTVGEYLQRCRRIVPNLYVEQITRNKCALRWRDPDETLACGDIMKLFCRREDLRKLDGKVGVVIPKKADTDLITLGLAVALGIVVGSVSIKGFGFGTGLCVLFAGIGMGFIHEKRPNMAGFPPQAVQLFSDFGLLGFLTLSGLAASMTIVEQIVGKSGEFFRDAALYLGCGLLVTVVPFLLTMLIGFWLFRKNISVLAFALAGSRSANPAEQELEKACGKSSGSYLAGAAFMIPYACANIFLTLLGVLIAKLLG
ncbi:MAG: hypothetical protein J5806_02960 [Lentisphaeria bacterium]|nr:hypothetical protein [Lentisphaeria bacterium]